MPFLSQGQKKISKIEAAVLDNRNLYRTETDDIDFYKGINISYFKLTNLKTHLFLSGIVVHANFKINNERKETTSYIDKDEIINLIKSKDYILSLSKQQKAKVFYDFVSRSGFTIGVLSDNNGLYYYIQLRKFDPETIINCDRDELKSFVEIIENAKKLL